MFRSRLGIFSAASACGALLISKSLLCDNSAVESKSKEHLKPLLDKKGLALWGSNAESVVDPENPGVSSYKTPRRLSAFDDISFKCVQLHKTYAAAVDSKGDLFVWGSAFFGKGQKHVPVRIASGLNIEKVALSDRYLTVLKSSGEVLSFEVKEGASADNVTKVALKVPQHYFDNEKATDIVAGKDHFLILSSKGSVYSAGSNSKGQLGSGEEVKQNDSTSQSSHIADLKLNLVGGIAGEVVEIASGDNHCLARTSDGRVYGWGSNESGELGEGVYSNDVPLFFNAPIELRKIWSVPKSVEVSSVGADGKITGIYAAGKNSYFVKEDASTIEVLAAGYGLNGQTGNGSPIHVASEPVRIRKLSGLSQYNEESKSMKPIEVEEIVASGTHAFAVIGSGSEGFGNDVLAWGSNTNGECFVDVPSLNIQSPVLVKPVFESDNDSIDRFQLVKTSRQDGKGNWGWLSALFGNHSNSKALLRTDISCGPHTTAVFTKSLILNPLRILARRTIFISKNTKAEKDGKSDMNKKVISTAGDKRLSSDVILRPPPSMRNNPLIRIDPPPNTPTNAPPKWMLKYFPHYFEREKLSDLGPEEHNQPYGATGVYGIIATGLLTFGLIAAHLYERLFTDSLESARYAVHEQRVREELKKLLKEAE